jgi:hypothetical protein
MPWGQLDTATKKAGKTLRKGRRTAKRAEVAGPYRSQSSNPKIRSKATPREHRTEPTTVRGVERQRARRARRVSAPARQAATDRRRSARKAERLEKHALKTLRDLKAPPAPQTAYQQARYAGIAPSSELKKLYPRAYKKSERAYLENIAKKEGVHADPLAEFAISTAATGGLGGAASIAGKAGAKGVAAIGAKLASTEATVGESALEKGVKGIAARTASKAGTKARAGAGRVRTAPKRTVARAKATPKRIKSAPKRAKRAAATKEGRRAAARGAGRSAGRHPVRTGYGAAAVSPVPLPGDVDKRARAAAKGTFAAITGHPGETAKTTLRSLPGAITAPAALLASGAESVIHGTPDPFVDEAKGQAEGLKQIASNVFSGDPKKAEEAARKEGSLAFVTPLPAVTRLRPFKRARTSVREGAATVRRKVAAKGEATNRSVRHAPRDVEQNVFATTARRQARKKTALIKQRADNPHRVAAAHHESQVIKHISKAPKGSEVALQTLAEYGIRDSKHAALVREKGPGDAQLSKALDYVETHPEVFQSKSFAEALEAVGEASRTAPAALVGKGERARLMQQGDVFGHARPEHMVPPRARGLTTASTREGAWAQLATADKRLTELRRAGRAKFDQAKVLADEKTNSARIAQARHRDHQAYEALSEAMRELAVEERHLSEGQAMLRRFKATGKRTDLFDFERRVVDSADRVKEKKAQVMDAREAQGLASKELKAILTRPKLSREQALQQGRSLYAQARSLKTRNKKLYDALDPYTRPGQSIDASKRTAYDSRQLAEYKQKIEASRQAAGMAPAIWTHHAEANTAGRGTGVENRFPTNAGRVEHMREGNLAKADNLDRSLQGLLRGTVQMPRLRAAGKQFGRDFVQEFKTPFKIDGKRKVVGQGSKDWTSITAPKSKDNPNGGQFDPKTWARFPLREWKNAVKDPFTEDSRLAELLTEAESGRIKGSEPWVLMPREAIREARAQISPEHNIITETANRASRVSSRLLLGTNPAWAIAQIPAEGIPLLMAKPSLLNPIKFASLERDIQRFKKSHPEEALALQATAGASPLNAAVNRTPLDMQETYTPALWDKGARALTRGKTARSVVSLAKLKALGTFDVKRQNEYRTLLAAAEADKRFRSWHGSLTGLFDSQARLSNRFKGKSRDELWTWLTKDPKGKKELEKITDYVDNIQGNWTAFTRYERSLAPLAIFYPFLRYSLRWSLWTFPKTHPITATLAYTLGQANANQLEKLVGGPLQNPIAYAFPAYQNAEGDTDVLPGGSRISPGQSSLTQALATGNTAQILSSANPVLGAGLTGITGIEPFTGEKTEEKGWAAINQLLSLPAPLRLAKVKVGDEQSVASKAFEQFDKSKAARSIGFPFIPQSGKDFAKSERLGKAFDEKYSNPVPSLPAEIWEAAYNKDWKLAQKLKDKRVAAERAGDIVKSAESPFFSNSGGELGDEGSKILQYITGTIQIPVEDEEAGTGSKYSGSSKYSSGNKYLEGNKYLSANKYGSG